MIVDARLDLACGPSDEALSADYQYLELNVRRGGEAFIAQITT
jgi:hypothetical protein